MGRESIPVASDLKKTREELLSELDELRARNSELAQCRARIEHLEAIVDADKAMTRELLEQAQYGVWVNIGNRVAFINEVGAGILGARPGEIVGKGLLEIIHPDYHDIVRQRISAMSHGDHSVPMLEEKYVRVDGSTVDVDVWAMRFVYEGKPAIIVAFKDISQRKSAEEVLGKNLAALAKSQEIARLGSWTMDFETGKYESSDELYRIHGFEPGTVEPDVHMKFKMIHPDDREKYGEYCKARRAGKLGSIDYRIIWPDNSEHYLHTETDSFTRGPDGRIVSAFGITQDVTERKRSEEQIKNAYEYYLKLFDEFPNLIWRSGTDGQCNYFNKSWLEFTGRTLEQEIGDCWISGIHPDDAERVRKEYTSAFLARKPFTFEYRLRYHDGSYRSIVDSAKPFYDLKGDFQGYIGSCLDISDRKKAEELVAAERKRFFTLLDNLPAFVYLQARDYSIRFANSRFKQLFCHDEPIPEGTRCYQVMTGRDTPCENCPTFKVFQTHKPQEWEWNSPGGKTYQIYDYPFIDVDGTPLIMQMGIDITDRRQAQAALQEAKAQVELYLDLMGHDIRNMNQIGMGYLELALDSPRIDRQDKELLFKSMGALENSTRLIENVRKMQKARTGKLKLQEMDACPVILRVLDHYTSRSGTKASITYDLPGACPVMANDLLYEVFENLVGNAVKHAGPGPMICVRSEAALYNGRSNYRFTVEDNGPGVPDDLKEKIFNRLNQGTAKGMGLGLYLVKSLVESYGGRVWVEDRVRGDHTKGARFVVMLPGLKTSH